MSECVPREYNKNHFNSTTEALLDLRRQMSSYERV